MTIADNVIFIQFRGSRWWVWRDASDFVCSACGGGAPVASKTQLYERMYGTSRYILSVAY